jgi:hypothetical protein
VKPWSTKIKEDTCRIGKELNVIVHQLAYMTMTSIADYHPEVVLMDSVKKDRALEMKRKMYKELLLKNTTFSELVTRELDMDIFKRFKDNVDRRNISGKLQTCFSFNEVIFEMH